MSGTSSKNLSPSAENGCDRCQERAVVTCLTCRSLFCMFHSKEHKRIKESHTLHDLHIPQRNKSIRDPSPPSPRSNAHCAKSDDSEEFRSSFKRDKSRSAPPRPPKSSAQSRTSEESEELRSNFRRDKHRRAPPNPPKSSAQSRTSEESEELRSNFRRDRRNPESAFYQNIDGLTAGKTRKDPPSEQVYETVDSGYSETTSDSNYSCGPCDACERATAVLDCNTCMAQFCQSCFNTHHDEHEYTQHDVHQLRRYGNSSDQQGSYSRHIQFTLVKSDSLSMSWPPPTGIGQHKFKVSWRGGQEERIMTVTRSRMDVVDLLPGEKYSFRVDIIDENNKSTAYASGIVNTEVPPPENLTVEVGSSGASLTWTRPNGVGLVSFLVDICKNGEHLNVIHRDSDHHTITGLQNGESYDVSVSTVLGNGNQSKPISKSFKVVHDLYETLSNLGMECFYGGNLTLRSVLEINRSTVSDGAPQSLKDLPWTFLRKLMICNINARHAEFQEDPLKQTTYNFDDFHIYYEPKFCFNSINPLDLITAVFHCSDHFLRQEMVTKMALCQFAVPLLLPNCDTQQNTLMLWAMRNIVKKFKMHSTAGDGAFVEGRVVDMGIPMVSFIRLGQSSLAKSQTLNKLLSNPHQHNNVFVYHGMEGGDEPRRISDGVVELSWYLPSGNAKTDLFSQPVAIANLRGDCKVLKTQISFLSQISAAIFIFTDDLQGYSTILTNAEGMSELFLVTNPQGPDYEENCKDIYRKLEIKQTNVIIKSRRSETEFLKTLRFYVSTVTERKRMKIVDMAACARQAGIQVDEDNSECVKGRHYAETISKTVKDISLFKEDNLPLHIQMWQEISQTQEEMYRLKNVNRAQGVKEYKALLKNKIYNIRKKQYQTDISEAMTNFTVGISQSEAVRLYFLRWLKIQLDHFSHQYPEQSDYQMPQALKATALYDQSYNYSLGLEHFFRELSQLYECACSLSGNNQARQQVQHLPTLCAQILLDGFPVELVDGDASNIPVNWMEAVFNQLHKVVDTKSRIQVVAVVGAQGSGKSTLLNTMFGAQFAVGSGRGSKGAYMQLIRVSEEFRSEIRCDFIMVINIAGLAPPELGLNTNYKVDNELATLLIGLSDITIINVTTENDAEIKDILQIVVHAFLRMKVRKKPRCLFVHQNVSDMVAFDDNKRERKRLEEQLNDMTKKAAKIENMDCSMNFSNVMEFDPDKDSYYIPGFWHGTPPMAPVNPGYSKAVYELKKNFMFSLKTSCNMERTDAKGFIKCTGNLLDAVKFESFIFNFRNSTVAEAYATLNETYEKWELSFRLVMHKWVSEKEESIQKSGQPSKSQVRETLQAASTVLDREEAKINQNLKEYFERKDRSVELVKEYKEEFKNNVNCLRKEMERAVEDWLKGPNLMGKGVEVNPYQTLTIQRKIRELQNSYREKKLVLTEDGVEREFEGMWESTLSEMYPEYSPMQDLCQSILSVLIFHFKTKSGHAKKLLSETNLETCGQGKFTVKKEWLWKIQDQYGVQKICNAVIKECEHYVAEKVQTKSTYNDTYITQLLGMVDKKMKDQTEECNVHLKLHVCGNALREFRKVQCQIRASNDTKTQLKPAKFNLMMLFKKEFNQL